MLFIPFSTISFLKVIVMMSQVNWFRYDMRSIKLIYLVITISHPLSDLSMKWFTFSKEPSTATISDNNKIRWLPRIDSIKDASGFFNHPCHFFLQLIERQVDVSMHSFHFETFLQHLREIDFRVMRVIVLGMIGEHKCEWMRGNIVQIVKFDGV